MKDKFNIYEKILTSEQKAYVDTKCPYKIGDDFLLTCITPGIDDIMVCKVMDIGIYTLGEMLLSRNSIECKLAFENLSDNDRRILYPRFSLFYVYQKKKPKPFWRFWEKSEFSLEEGVIDIDEDGYSCGVFSNYMLEKCV